MPHANHRGVRIHYQVEGEGPYSSMDSPIASDGGISTAMSRHCARIIGSFSSMLAGTVPATNPMIRAPIRWPPRACLHKPFTPYDLARKVREALASASAP